MMLSKYIYLVFGLLAFVACGSSSSKTTVDTVKEEPAAKVNVPVFNADSAYQFVKMQTDMGPRVPNSETHKKAAGILAAELRRHGADVKVQEFDALAYNRQLLKGYNIIGSYNPESSNRILLFAHWDTRPYADADPNKANHKKPIDGANDGASGVGVLLEMARQFGVQNPTIGVDIMLLDLEDFGTPYFGTNTTGEEAYCLGSQYWAKNPHERGYKARYGILLDMVGDKNAKFSKDLYSMRFAPSVVNKVWTTAQKLGYGNYFVNETGSFLTDDHIYVNQYGIPAIDIIDYDNNREKGFADSWHTKDDTIENIDPKTLKAVGQTLLEVIYSEK
ncbi:MAG: M28 family peptidase [Bacteroidales bacterium]